MNSNSNPSQWEPNHYKKHKGSTFFRQDGFAAFWKKVDSCARQATLTSGEVVMIDAYRVVECYSRASHSLKFHKNKQFSVYKEASHLAFWIAKLKPFRFRSADHSTMLMRKAQDIIMEAIVGIYPSLENHEWEKVKHILETKVEEAGREQQDEINKILDFPLNEAIALTLMFDVIEAAQRAAAEKEPDAQERQIFIHSIDTSVQSREWLHAKWCESFRNHNHTSRSFAMMVESTLKTTKEKLNEARTTQ